MRFNLKKKNNHEKLEEGVWVALDDEKYQNRLVIDDPEEGPAVRVASTESRRYKTGYERVVRKHRDVIRAQNYLPWQVRELAEKEGLLEAITDWRMIDEDGIVVPFSRSAVEWLLDNEIEARQRLNLVANDLTRYKQEEEEADKKNLPTISSGLSNGRAIDEGESPGATLSH